MQEASRGVARAGEGRHMYKKAMKHIMGPDADGDKRKRK